MRTIVTMIALLILITRFGFAQDTEEPNTVLVIKYAMNWAPEGGSNAEFDSLMALSEENIIKKNKYIKSQMVVAHYYGSNSEDMLIIRELNGSGLDIILKAAEEQGRLFREWKPKKEDREAWGKTTGKYYKGEHSDEIYVSLSNVIN